MEKIILIGIVALIITILLCVSGIYYMKDSHDDYNGEDFSEDKDK